jgi:hypothetical protein
MFSSRFSARQISRLASINFGKKMSVQKFNKGRIVWMDMEMTGDKFFIAIF